MLQASNVGVPCDLSFNGQLRPGSNLLINGLFPVGADGFLINLNCGRRRPGFPEPDTALMINPRMSQHSVVRNSKINGNWGIEERAGSFVFAPGHYFSMAVTANAYEFKLSVNGNPLADYKYRVPLNRINSMVIEGNVIINEITTGGMAAPFNQPSGHNTFGHGMHQQHNAGLLLQVANPAVPSTITIPGNLRDGMKFIIKGRPIPGGDRFIFNWMCTNGDTAFHFNPRMHDAVIVRNTKKSSKWGAEERSCPYFPFHPSVDFNVTVTAMPNYFDVRVNGNLQLIYNHRIYPITAITALKIDGAVTITNITINNY